MRDGTVATVFFTPFWHSVWLGLFAPRCVQRWLSEVSRPFCAFPSGKPRAKTVAADAHGPHPRTGPGTTAVRWEWNWPGGFVAPPSEVRLMTSANTRKLCSFEPFIASITQATRMLAGFDGFGSRLFGRELRCQCQRTRKTLTTPLR